MAKSYLTVTLWTAAVSKLSDNQNIGGGLILHDPTYMTFWKRQHYREMPGSCPSGSRVIRRGDGVGEEKLTYLEM